MKQVTVVLQAADASIEDPDAGDVWGYLIMDRIQQENYNG